MGKIKERRTMKSPVKETVMNDDEQLESSDDQEETIDNVWNQRVMEAYWKAAHEYNRLIETKGLVSRSIQGVSKLLQHAGKTWLIRQVLVENPRPVT
jgi:hypothetical protein